MQLPARIFHAPRGPAIRRVSGEAREAEDIRGLAETPPGEARSMPGSASAQGGSQGCRAGLERAMVHG